MKDDCFKVKYTNKDIMDKIDEVNIKLTELTSQVKTTNGSIKLHQKLIWGVYGFAFAILILVIQNSIIK